MRIRILTIAMAAVALSNIAAHAHAFLDHASPLVGSTVASASSSLRRNPVTPSSIISGAAPHGVVTTGVPQASASS